MVWYSHLFKSFPQFVMLHTVKGFSIVDETEVDVLLELSSFLCDPVNVGVLFSGSSSFSKPSLDIWKFLVQNLSEQVSNLCLHLHLVSAWVLFQVFRRELELRAEF